MIGDFHYDIFKQYGPAKEAYQKALRLMSPGQESNRLKEKVDALDKKLENQRRMREGKPPLPEKAPHDHGHDHGPGGLPGMPPGLNPGNQ